jgi:DNA-binding response OmpR family regulator
MFALPVLVQPLHILILEDDKDAAALMCVACQLRRHAVRVTHDLEAARRALDRHQPDVFIADFHIGNGHSGELLATVKDCFPSVRCLLVTGAESGEWSHLVALGLVRAALRKPFDPLELITLVER